MTCISRIDIPCLIATIIKRCMRHVSNIARMVVKYDSEKKKRKNEHYGTNKPLLRWKQATDTVFFESYQIQQLYNILCELKFKNKFIIYFIDCAFCIKSDMLKKPKYLLI